MLSLVCLQRFAAPCIAQSSAHLIAVIEHLDYAVASDESARSSNKYLGHCVHIKLVSFSNRPAFSEGNRFLALPALPPMVKATASVS